MSGLRRLLTLAHRLKDRALQFLYAAPSVRADPVALWEAERVESLEFQRKKEPEQNKATQLPAEQTVNLAAVRVAEIYLSSHVPNLLAHLDALGWVPDWDLGTEHALPTWIQTVRRQGRGAGRHAGPWIWNNRHTRPKPAGYDFSALLPEGVTALNIEIVQPSSSYVVAYALFLLEDSASDRLNEALRRSYTTEVEAVGAGWTYVEPGQQRRIEADKVRSHIRTDCCAYLAENLPGFFATSHTDVAEFPTAELIFLSSGSLLSDETRKRPSFFDGLGLDAPFLDLLGTEYEGLILRLPPDSGAGDRGLVFAATLDELMPGDDLSSYGGRSVNGFVHRLGGLADVLGLWAVAQMLASVDTKIADVRDRIGVNTGDSHRDHRLRLEGLQQEVAAMTSDLLFTLHDCQDQHGLEYLASGAADFRARDPRLWREEAMIVSIVHNIKGEADRVAQAMGMVREALQVWSNLVLARASDRVAQTNVMLQALALLIALIALLTTLVLQLAGSH
jgi:hypothetical protein